MTKKKEKKESIIDLIQDINAWSSNPLRTKKRINLIKEHFNDSDSQKQKAKDDRVTRAREIAKTSLKLEKDINESKKISKKKITKEKVYSILFGKSANRIKEIQHFYRIDNKYPDLKISYTSKFRLGEALNGEEEKRKRAQKILKDLNKSQEEVSHKKIMERLVPKKKKTFSAHLEDIEKLTNDLPVTKIKSKGIHKKSIKKIQLLIDQLTNCKKNLESTEFGEE